VPLSFRNPEGPEPVEWPVSTFAKAPADKSEIGNPPRPLSVILEWRNVLRLTTLV
jgi:hypothetical protein